MHCTEQHTHLLASAKMKLWCGASSSTQKYRHTIGCAALWIDNINCYVNCTINGDSIRCFWIVTTPRICWPVVLVCICAELGCAVRRNNQDGWWNITLAIYTSQHHYNNTTTLQQQQHHYNNSNNTTTTWVFRTPSWHHCIVLYCTCREQFKYDN